MAVLAVRLVIGAMFLVSGAMKVGVPSAFTDGIMRYDLLTRSQARIVAHVLPPTELAVGALYLSGLQLVLASAVSIALLLSFTGAIVMNLARGRRFPCNCFGASHASIGPVSVLRNVLLLAAAVFVLVGSVQPIAGLGYGYQLAPWPWRADVLFPLVGIVLLSLAGIFLLGELDWTGRRDGQYGR
ncbi:MAG: MauE/DoxX family redox-associated membrane protein [Chloroflexota bacterium]